MKRTICLLAGLLAVILLASCGRETAPGGAAELSSAADGDGQTVNADGGAESEEGEPPLSQVELDEAGELTQEYIRVAYDFDKNYFLGRWRESDMLKIVTTEDQFRKRMEDEEYYEDEIDLYLEDWYNVTSLWEYWHKDDEYYGHLLEERYGRNVEVRFVELLSIHEYTPEELEKLKIDRHRYYQIYGIEIDELTAAFDVEFNLEVSGSHTTKEWSRIRTVVKYKGEWKIN